jgi:hypothetical protein
MRRRILIALLALGTVGGYAAGFAHMHHSSSCHNWDRNGDWHGRGYNNAAHYDCNGSDQQRDSR